MELFWELFLKVGWPSAETLCSTTGGHRLTATTPRACLGRRSKDGASVDGVDEIVAEFLVESYENLEQLAQELVELEHNPTGHELLASVFRSIHTIKGTSGFLGFSHLEKVTHVGESLLSRLRDG